MPIRCVVEHVTSPSEQTFDTAGSAPCERTSVAQEAFAILPVNTPLKDLPKEALRMLGYSWAEAVTAKGAIQLKNWKPITFDVITDDKLATIDDILRGMNEYTLRIRLASQPRQKSAEEMREKLKQLLQTSPHSVLVDIGCPLDKNFLMSLSSGENLTDIPDDVVKRFESWYTDMIAKDPKCFLSALATLGQPAAENLSKREAVGASKVEKANTPIKMEPEFTHNQQDKVEAKGGYSSSSSSSSLSSSLPHPPHPQMMANGLQYQPHSSLPSSQQPQPPQLPGGVGLGGGPNHSLQPSVGNVGPSKTRIRTSFDPEHEIPRLQKWFQTSQHPSREQMMRYMHELNTLESRKGRRPLDLTNIIYWFKNARAAQRRATKTVDNSFENEENVDVSSGGHSTPGLDGGGGGIERGGGGGGMGDPSPIIPPHLPNKNAVYIYPHPFYSTHLSSSSSSSNPLISTPDPLGGDSNDEPCDLSIKKLSETSSNQQDPRTTPTSRKGSEGCQENRELLSVGGRSNGSHSRKGSPVRNGYSKSAVDDGYVSPSVFNGLENRHSSTPLSKDRGRERELDSAEERSRKLIKLYHARADHDDREQRLVMDFKEEADVSDDESLQSNDSNSGGGRLRIQDEDELEYMVRARAEMGLAGLGPLTSEAGMAALGLAQMAQPQAMLSMAQHHMNPLAMYYGMAPRYYQTSHPTSHHHHSQATAAMVAALSGQSHMNGHAGSASGGGGGNHHSSSSSSNPQSPAGSQGRAVPIQPPSHSHSHSASLSSQPRDRSSEPRKRRTRVFIDPLTEIPRLEKWFTDDTHPSAYMIDKYTETLNKAEYRQKFPRLEAKNIQLWFKNHRAKVKRHRVVGSDSVCGSPPPDTPLNMVSGCRDESGSGCASTSSPDKHSNEDLDHAHCDDDDMEEGEQ